MKFQQALNEYSFDVPLQQWNNKQKNIWLELVKQHIVKLNDIEKFTKMAKVFDEFYKRKHAFPTVKYVRKML
jgi:hypothetical protein